MSRKRPPDGDGPLLKKQKTSVPVGDTAEEAIGWLLKYGSIHDIREVGEAIFPFEYGKELVGNTPRYPKLGTRGANESEWKRLYDAHLLGNKTPHLCAAVVRRVSDLEKRHIESAPERDKARQEKLMRRAASKKVRAEYKSRIRGYFRSREFMLGTVKVFPMNKKGPAPPMFMLVRFEPSPYLTGSNLCVKVFPVDTSIIEKASAITTRYWIPPRDFTWFTMYMENRSNHKHRGLWKNQPVYSKHHPVTTVELTWSDLDEAAWSADVRDNPAPWHELLGQFISDDRHHPLKELSKSVMEYALLPSLLPPPHA